jgi:eukaryotic-like serine/threonine-protein kinase
LEAVILKALAKNPANRYPSADEFRADLLRFREGKPVLAEPLLAPPADATQAVAATQAQQVYSDSTTAMPAATAPPVAAPPRRTWGFFIVLLVLLLILAGLLFALARTLGVGDSSGDVAVPNVVTLTQPVAIAELDRAGFDARVETAPNAAAEGTVFDQDPDAGRDAEEGSTVTINVSEGPALVSVPDVRGLQIGEARQRLNDAGLQVNADDEPSDQPDGVVFGQDHLGEEVDAGTVINLVVSSGPTTTTTQATTTTSSTTTTTTTTTVPPTTAPATTTPAPPPP